MKRISARGIGACTAVALTLTCGAAAGQAYGSYGTFDSSPLMIEQVPAPAGEQIAKRGESFFVRPMRSVRAARLEEPASVGKGMLTLGAAHGELPAGTRLFGVEVRGGWLYCAVSESTNFLLVDETTCFGDADRDGRFDQVRPSGAPFGGVPLLVLRPGAPAPLAQPVRYTEIDYAEGPSVELALYWEPIKPKAKPSGDFGAAPRPVIGASFGRRVDKAKGPPAFLGFAADVYFDSLPQTVEVDGVTLEILGLTSRKELRYRVLAVQPPHAERIKMVNNPSPY